MKEKIIECYGCKKEIIVGIKNNYKYNLCEECKNNIDIINEIKQIQLLRLEKRRKTYLEKYGVENPFQSEEIKDKIKKKNLEKYGVENPRQNSEINEKSKKTCIEKYGVENPMKNEEIKEKQINKIINKTSDEKEEIKNKRKNTIVEKYGVEHQMQLEEIKEKIKNTNLEKYGVENIFQLKEIKEKIKNTNIIRYGVEHVMHNENIKNKNKKTRRNNFFNILLNNLNLLELELINEYTSAQDHSLNFKCLRCNHIFETNYYNINNQNYRCPICYPRTPRTSVLEKEIFDFIRNINTDIIKNCKDVISPHELDIFIPHINIGIEFNGLYWHSELFKTNPHYHLNKLKICQEKGIRLIQIFEDEWIFKQDIVKARLKQIIKKFNGNKIHARKCEIKEIDSKSKNEFLEKYHIQGKDISIIRLGSFYNNELISIMTFSHGNISKGSKSEENVWELSRFCSNYNYHIPGIASKLLSYFKKNYNWKKIFSYADLRWSEGNVYNKLGFKLSHQTKPNYWYSKCDGIRIHRFNLRKKPDEPKDISERLLRQYEGYYRIWDCGNLKFIMENE